MTNPKTYIINDFLHYYRQREDQFTRDKSISEQKIKDFFKAAKMVINLINIKSFNPEFKSSMTTYATNYKVQFHRTEHQELADACYNEYIASV